MKRAYRLQDTTPCQPTHFALWGYRNSKKIHHFHADDLNPPSPGLSKTQDKGFHAEELVIRRNPSLRSMSPFLPNNSACSASSRRSRPSRDSFRAQSSLTARLYEPPGLAPWQPPHAHAQPPHRTDSASSPQPSLASSPASPFRSRRSLRIVLQTQP